MIAALFSVFSTLLVIQASPITREEQMSICSSISSLADAVMEARQTGVPMSQMMEVTSNLFNGGDLDEIIGEIGEVMIIDAYEEPRYSTPEMQRRQREDFRNRWEVACYRDLRED